MRDPDDDTPAAAAILLIAVIALCAYLVVSFAVEITIHQLEGARMRAEQAERNGSAE